MALSPEEARKQSREYLERSIENDLKMGIRKANVSRFDEEAIGHITKLYEEKGWIVTRKAHGYGLVTLTFTEAEH